MGYNVSMGCSGVIIPAERVAAAIKDMKELMGQKHLMGGGSSDGSSWFSWVDTGKVLEALDAGDLAKAFEEWRYSASTTPRSPVEQLAAGTVYADVDYFMGDKLGDDQELWSWMAEHVAEGALITCMGEDEYQWRWRFNGTSLHEETGFVIWGTSFEEAHRNSAPK